MTLFADEAFVSLQDFFKGVGYMCGCGGVGGGVGLRIRMGFVIRLASVGQNANGYLNTDLDILVFDEINVLNRYWAHKLKKCIN